MNKKVLCRQANNAPYHILKGWKEVFDRIDYEWVWLSNNEHVIPAFDKHQPDIFIGTTYDLDRATIKCASKYPDTYFVLKGSNWGQSTKDCFGDTIVNVTEEEKSNFSKLVEECGNPPLVFNFYHICDYGYTMMGWEDAGATLFMGLPAADIFNYKPVDKNPHLECDVGFVGGYWGYKGINLRKYLFPLCFPVYKYNIKIFGNQPWPLPQYMGPASTKTELELFSSSLICPNISEPHANKFGFEVNERVFKLAACKAFCISDNVSSLEENIFTNNELVISDDEDHFQDLIYMFTINPESRQQHIDSCYKTVMNKHTYCHRVSGLLKQIGWEEDSQKCLTLI